jgi:hypothetical protein
VHLSSETITGDPSSPISMHFLGQRAAQIPQDLHHALKMSILKFLEL